MIIVKNIFAAIMLIISFVGMFYASHQLEKDPAVNTTENALYVGIIDICGIICGLMIGYLLF